MSIFVQSTPAPRPKSENVKLVSIGLAGVFVVLAVAQLYSYEDFPSVITSLGLHDGRPLSDLYAALLVTGEVLAIPFLLSMRLSRAMRFVSMTAGWLVIIAWLKTAVIVNVTANAVTNSGVLGATIPIVPGWWMVCFFMVLALMSAWASWGMWPAAVGKNNT
ncbi:MAG: rane protein of unknown function [Candidatus Saccharibacteria bacterium]|nr:rane protein of unknown function [Candidatus Saccharibacteria bacterium]